MAVENALEALRFNPRFMRNIVRWERVAERPARHAPFPAGLDARLIDALAGRGIEALYSHQADAVAAAMRGENVAVVTAAASGKTFCYNLPVLHRLLAETEGRALYLFPTKALADDQLTELHDLLAAVAPGQATEKASSSGRGRKTAAFPAFPSPGLPAASAPQLTAEAYDGDTPTGQRARIRDHARIVLTNPDMLHMGILPQHPRWAAFFANLRVVVVDEMHVYRGVFGSHVANVLRRLRRICRFYGSSPQFILASATIANPGEVAARLVEAPVTVIGPERDGAPQGEKQLLFYNPPLVDPALGIRRSSSTEAADVAGHFLEHAVQTIVFARARMTTELILTYLRSESEATNGLPGSAIRGYRGGYLPLERREIERGLREGVVRTVVATNALELGIDIGRLDAAVLAGYPGTIASTRQQMGRAGRRQGPSVGVLVAGPDPLDQYIVAHPEWVLSRSPEHARLNPDNAVILAGHLACAAVEIPVRAEEVFGPHDRVDELLAELTAEGQLYAQGGRYFWAGDASPAAALSLREAGPEQVVIQSVDEAGRPDVIGQIDRLSAPAFVYTGAIYLHEGASYQVEALDWENSVAHVRPVSVDYYTRPSIAENIEVVETRESEHVLECSAEAQLPQPRSGAHSDSQLWEGGYLRAWGDVRVISQATGYRILRRGTNETLGYGVVDLPEQVLETQGCWLTMTDGLIEKLRSTGAWLSSPNEYGPNWPEQRKAARARDGFRCQGCGSIELPGHEHDVHHKIPFRAFVADAMRREGRPADQAWQVANRLENLVTLCPGCHRRAEANVRTRSGLGGTAQLLTAVIPLFLMCDPSDVGILPEPQNPVSGLPTITMFEKVAGGIGYAEELYRSLPEVLEAAHDLVRNCPCDTGCPACVGPVPEHDYMLDTKMLTSALLTALRCEG